MYSDGGIGFGTAPTVTIPGNGGVATGAVGLASIGIDDTQGFNEVKNIFITNPGQNIQLNQQLQYLIQKHLVVLEHIILMKLFKVCVQEHKQELKIGIRYWYT